MPGEIYSAETEGSVPLLISRPFMEKLSTVLDLSRGTVSFEAIGVYNLPLQKTSKGHLAVDLLGDKNQDPYMTLKPCNKDAEYDDYSSVSPGTSPKSNRTSWPPEAYELPPDARDSDDGDRQFDDEVQEDYLEHLRAEVEHHDDIMRSIGDGEPDRLHGEGFVCEDLTVFEQLLEDESFIVRKTTAKKGKKLDTMSRVLDSDDWDKKRNLQSQNPRAVKRLPPFGKTWIKQLFAGQMGLTLAAVVIGMQVATPLDSSSSTWDASTSAGVKWVNRDMQVEDPYLTVITHPCGPWGAWSKFNLHKGGAAAETVLLKREENRPVLKTVNKVIKQRIKAKRHVFVEQPWGSASLQEPEMSDVKDLVESGDLIMIKVDGCMVGYRDAESGLPHQKSSYYLTSMIAAESVFTNHLCNGDHKHQPLEGANCFGPRTAQAAEWPSQLNWMVLEAVIQQASVEATAAADVQEAFPSEVRALQDQQQGQRKSRRKGRVLTLSAPLQAPPVYVRPQAPDEPLPQLEDVPAHEDDASFRAASASALEPVLSENESVRRHEWLQVDPQLRKILRDLHVNFGHPTSSTLQRILRRQNAKPEAIKAAGLMSCDACGETIRRRRPKPVRLPNRYEFNRHILADTMFAKDARGVTYGFLNVIDDATGFQMVSCLGELQGVPAAQVILRHFTASWSSWAGLPTSMQVDRGKEYLAEFANYLRQFGVEQEVMPLEAPWKGGKCEKAGGLWKDLFYKTVIDSQIQGLSDVILATSIVTQTRNSFPRFNGYSPMQWVLGVGDLKLPGALLDGGGDPNLEVLEASLNPHSEMARTLAVRESARVAQIRMDTDSRVRRALLKQSTPTRGPYPVGAYVYFFKAQKPRDDQRNYRWFGPARVIGVELRNPRRLEDEDPATDGGQPHSYWLRYGPAVILATGEQLRFASEDELLAAHHVPHYAVQPDQVRGARQYLDVRSHTRPFGEMPHHGLPDGPLPQIQEGDDDVVLDLPAGDAPGHHPQIAGHAVAGHPQQPQLEQAPAQPAQPSPLTIPTSSSYRRQVTEPEPAPTVPSTPMTTNQEQQATTTTQESMRGQQALPSALPSQLQHQPDSLPLDFQQVPQPHTPLNTAMNNPDRLDGLGPTRTTRHIGRNAVSGPYLAEEDIALEETYGTIEDDDWQVICPGMEDSIRRLRLKELLSESEADEFDSYILTDANPAEIFLTGRAVRSEINLKDLKPAERELFDQAMAKEWDSWMKFNAVEVLTEEQVAALPQDAEVIGTRWVHTDKNRKTRMMLAATSKKTKKTQEQIDREHPLAAKSRIVVQGNQECDTGIRSDSPTASLLAFNLVCAVAVMHNWLVKSYDASTAYLQAKGIARLLILRPPRPPPPGISIHDLFRAKGSIYGTKDAGRSWWIKLLHDAKAEGWIPSKIEAALFFLYDGDVLVGVMVTHVDDLFVCGSGSKYEESMKTLTTKLHLKENSGSFKFCGKNVTQSKDGTITLDQKEMIEVLEYQVISKDRRTKPNMPLTETEKTQFRGLVGSMGWITRQTRPDVLVNVSMAAQTMGKPTVRDVLDLNKGVKMLKESKDAVWSFKPSEINLSNCVVFTCADSSFANVNGMKSQCGYIVGLSLGSLPQGDPTPVLILETNSSSIKRVCRSTLAAESNAVLMGVEAADYVRSILVEMTNPGVKVRNLEKEFVKRPLLAFTDAKSLEATVTKDAGQPSDKRVKILVSQIKEVLNEGRNPEEGSTAIHWCDTSQMAADVLTKLGCERELLLDILSRGVWQLEPTETAKAKKERIRMDRQLRKYRAKRTDEGEDG